VVAEHDGEGIFLDRKQDWRYFCACALKIAKT